MCHRLPEVLLLRQAGLELPGLPRSPGYHIDRTALLEATGAQEKSEKWSIPGIVLENGRVVVLIEVTAGI